MATIWFQVVINVAPDSAVKLDHPELKVVLEWEDARNVYNSQFHIKYSGILHT